MIPKTWDESALADLEVPLADPRYSPKHISAEQYYRIPVRPIYKSYPKYHPDKEHSGYRDLLRQQEPVILWDDGAHRPKLETDEDWIKAGELVFNAPILFGLQTSGTAEMRTSITETGDLFDKNGVSPFAVYVVRERGKLEIGEISCAECHSRIMPDGSVIAGAQGNRPIEQIAYGGMSEDADNADDRERFLAEVREGQRRNFAAPWLIAQFASARYSDEQLYAMALYIYSLKPPVNPNKFDARAQQGRKVFEREGCAACHTPPLYTSNELMPVEGFKVPEEHRNKFDVSPMSPGTDPTLTLRTRRGTGYYKVPSLKGVWYRGPFEHNGSVATLEDWFDPRRLRDDYVPTGWKGYGVKTRAVKGHEFGLKLSAGDKRALITFLKTL